MFNYPQTFMFIGRSGCGKGTQAALLQEYLKKKDPKREILTIETGAKIRAFIAKEKGYAAELSRAIYNAGGLQPGFLTAWTWSSVLIKELRADTHLMFDGTPRRILEAHLLDSAFKFFKREKPHLILLNVSGWWARERLLARKRMDDGKKGVDARLAWYDTEVVPAIEFYRNNSDYRFHDINGEQRPEKVHEDTINQIERGH